MEKELEGLNIDDGEEEEANMLPINPVLQKSALKNDENPKLVLLIYSAFWVQDDLPPGFFSKAVAKQLDKFVGFNLEGYHNIDFSNQSGSSSSMDQINMDHDVEDDPLVNVDEKKKPRTEEMVPNVSNFIDSFGALV
ncbi:hypothetical protein Goarm_000614 [Gossypium armourianum]|uniref:Uncharacterized protein n=1 Tax=Gossypium armourianum TaxID=34283 RepID=A0A7J9KAD2_9ROSI|nr:hypothetical protein [Gossypium armourianum]